MLELPFGQLIDLDLCAASDAIVLVLGRVHMKLPFLVNSNDLTVVEGKVGVGVIDVACKVLRVGSREVVLKLVLGVKASASGVELLHGIGITVAEGFVEGTVVNQAKGAGGVVGAVRPEPG